MDMSRRHEAFLRSLVLLAALSASVLGCQSASSPPKGGASSPPKGGASSPSEGGASGGAVGPSMIVGYFKPAPLMELASVSIQSQRSARFLLPRRVEVVVLPEGFFYALNVKPGRYVITDVSERNSITRLASRNFPLSYIPRKESYWSFDVLPGRAHSVGAYSLSSFGIFLAQSSANYVSEHPTMDAYDVIEELLPRFEGTAWHDLLVAELGRE